MKKLKIVLTILLVICVCSLSAKGKHNKPVYAFGISESFTDSIVYNTNIQVIDSVYLDANGFLPARDSYAYQLKNYLEINKELTDRTCMIFFNTDMKKLTKEFNKVVARYKKKNVIVKSIKPEEFKFTKPEE